jgi:methylglyoxal synthase
MHVNAGHRQMGDAGIVNPEEALTMQQNHELPVSGVQYPLVAVGTALLAAVVIVALQTALATIPLDGVTDSLQRVATIFNVPVAALMSAASLVIFSGLWRSAARTEAGAWGLNTAIVLLVALNWAAWMVALWWN